MIKRCLSFILSLCLSGSLIVTAFAQQDAAKKEYYSIEIKQVSSEYANTTYFEYADFMVLTEGKSTKVYIKAEDFAKITKMDSKSPYTYNQTYTECAFVSSETGHVVRFLFDSTNVMVFYACNDLLYEAPYKAVYENGVAWIPFEFAAKLFDIDAVPDEYHIKVSSQDYNALAVTNLIHTNIRDYGFDPVKEYTIHALDESVPDIEIMPAAKNEQLNLQASSLMVMNDLLSFEPTEWGTVLLSFVGFTAPYDEEFVEVISDSFLVPSNVEAEKLESFAAEKITESGELLEKLKKGDMPKKNYAKSAEGVTEALNDLVVKFPEISDVKTIQGAQEVLALPEGKHYIKDFLKFFGDSFLEEAGNFTKFIGNLLETAHFLHFVNIYVNKSDRALASLKQYASDCKYDEARILEDNCISSEHPIVGYIVDKAMREASDIVNNGVLLWMGKAGAVAKGAGFAWDFVSQASPIKKTLDGAKSRVIANYAIKYQDDSFGLYYKYYGECLEGGQNSEEELEKMLNSLYAYLKFSFIARNSMGESTKLYLYEKSGTDDEYFSNKIFEIMFMDKNETIAEYLTYLEQDIFTPTDAKELASTVGEKDKRYAEALREYGAPIEDPKQKTVPVFEFPAFPGAKELEYITEEEAIELAKRTVTKMSGGLLESSIISSMIYEMTGTTEMFTYVSLGGYIVDGTPEAYVVDVRSENVSQMLLFVSLIGNEVWLGAASDSSPEGYYVYKELDLLHADRGDYLAAIGDLTFALVDAYQ